MMTGHRLIFVTLGALMLGCGSSGLPLPFTDADPVSTSEPSLPEEKVKSTSPDSVLLPPPIKPVPAEVAQRCNKSEMIGMGPFATAQVAGSDRLYFRQLGDACPAYEPACVEHSYVVGGDSVLTSSNQGDWTCGWYHSQKGTDTVGWLPVARLVLDSPTVSNWTGGWHGGNSSFDLKQRPDGMVVGQGSAVRVASGEEEPYLGEVDIRSRPINNKMNYKDEYCSLFLEIVRDWLVVHESGSCGGLGVTFMGIYTR